MDICYKMFHVKHFHCLKIYYFKKKKHKSYMTYAFGLVILFDFIVVLHKLL